MSLPKDKFLLLSYVNTQLRDNYPNLDEFCMSVGTDKAKLLDDLKSIDYHYCEEQNAFK